MFGPAWIGDEKTLAGVLEGRRETYWWFEIHFFLLEMWARVDVFLKDPHL